MKGQGAMTMPLARAFVALLLVVQTQASGRLAFTLYCLHSLLLELPLGAIK